MSKPVEFQGHPYSFTKNPPTYRAVCKRVKDGDTYEMFIDFGLRKYAYEEVRLRGLDTPEIFHPRNAAEAEHGEQAKSFAEGMLLTRSTTITTYADTVSYGRFVADVKVWDAVAKQWRNLAVLLAAAGMAKRDNY